MKRQGFDGFGCEVYEQDGKTWVSTYVDDSVEIIVKYAIAKREQGYICKLMTVNKWGSVIDYIE